VANIQRPSPNGAPERAAETAQTLDRGLRLLLLENSGWRGGQAKLAASAGGLSIVLAIVFLARVL